MKVTILNSIGKKRIAKIEFERGKEKEVIEKLKKAGFEVDVRKYGW